MNFFFIRIQNRFVRIEIKSIHYILSVGHYSKIVTDNKIYVPHLSLKDLETALPELHFCRVNKSSIVNISKIQSFDKDNVWMADASFILSEFYKKVLLSRVTVLIHQEKISNDE